MENLKTFIKNKLPIFIIKIIIIFIFSYLFLVVSLNNLEKFLFDLDISTILSNYNDEFIRFLSSEEIKNQIKILLNYK